MSRLLTIILPIYNEDKTLKSVISQLQDLRLPENISKEIIAIDDGSTDDSLHILSSYSDQFTVISKPNGGKGSAVRLGFQKARGDYVVVKDADLEQKTDDIVKILNHMIQYNCDLVIGSRFMSDYEARNGIFRMHLITNRIYSMLVSYLVGLRINDVWSGYKMLNKQVLGLIKDDMTEDGIEFELELLFKLSGKNYIVHEIPISYDPRWYDQGKKTNYRHLFSSFYYIFKKAIGRR